MKSIIRITLVFCLGCSISGCGGYSSHGNTPLSQTLAGTWDFTYVSSTSGSSTVSGSAITGTLTETSPETISVMGTLASTGNSASGTYQVMSATGACAAASGDTGTWSGTRTAVPIGPYSAMVRSADRLPVQVTLNLTVSGACQAESGAGIFTKMQ